MTPRTGIVTPRTGIVTPLDASVTDYPSKWYVTPPDGIEALHHYMHRRWRAAV